MTFKGEQVVYGEMHTPDEIELMQLEISKYNWALPYCSHKTVVDFCCGTGFGTFMLSLVADGVVGYDRNAEAIKYANDNWRSKITFEVLDLDKYLPTLEWDVAVCFEGLEHLENPDYLLSHVKASRFICSVPINSGTGEFHKINYGTDSDAIELMTRNGWKVTHSERFNRPNGTGSLMMICER